MSHTFTSLFATQREKHDMHAVGAADHLHSNHTLGNELGDRRGVWDAPVPTTSHCQSTVEPHRRNTICLRREQEGTHSSGAHPIMAGKGRVELSSVLSC
jgi:hypothetical protein